MKWEGKLEVGQPAMIIGCNDPANSWIIGRIVVVKHLVSVGEALPSKYFTLPEEILTHIRSVDEPTAVVEGYYHQPFLIEGHGYIRQKYLMPLPPLDENVEEYETLELEGVQ